MRDTFGGIELAYDVQGAGPVVVLLHGFAVDRRMWDSTYAALASQFRVVRLDFRGAGESPSGHAFSLAELADDVAHVLDKLGVPMAALVGLSMGGYVALAFAERHRARLSALVLADTKSLADSFAARALRDASMLAIKSFGPAAYAENVPLLLGPHATDAQKSHIKALAASQSAASLIAFLHAMRERPDRTGELARIDCPTLVVVGEHDVLSPVDEMRALADKIRGAKMQVLPGVGHISNLEAPAAFDVAVGEFLAADLCKE